MLRVTDRRRLQSVPKRWHRAMPLLVAVALFVVSAALSGCGAWRRASTGDGLTARERDVIGKIGSLPSVKEASVDDSKFSKYLDVAKVFAALPRDSKLNVIDRIYNDENYSPGSGEVRRIIVILNRVTYAVPEWVSRGQLHAITRPYVQPECSEAFLGKGKAPILWPVRVDATGHPVGLRSGHTCWAGVSLSMEAMEFEEEFGFRPFVRDALSSTGSESN